MTEKYVNAFTGMLPSKKYAISEFSVDVVRVNKDTVITLFRQAYRRFCRTVKVVVKCAMNAQFQF